MSSTHHDHASQPHEDHGHPHEDHGHPHEDHGHPHDDHGHPHDDHGHPPDDHGHPHDDHGHPHDDHGHPHDDHGHPHDDHGDPHDEQGHGHGHGHEHRGGVIGFVKELFVPHSHDSADKVDSALETSKDGMRCLKISFIGLMLTALMQTVIVYYTNSVALLGDTLHNYADAFTAVPLAIAFIVGRRLATRSYNYGYGRAEDLAGIIVVVLIALLGATPATRPSSGS